MDIDYLVLGRITKQCWHDPEDPTRVFGKHEIAEEAANLDEVFESIARYFAEHHVPPGDSSRFVTVSEHDSDTGLTSERIFTSSDVLSNRHRAFGEVQSIAKALVENGRRLKNHELTLTR